MASDKNKNPHTLKVRICGLSQTNKESKIRLQEVHLLQVLLVHRFALLQV